MKLFWRIFYSTMIVSVACFSIGAYILIHTGVQSSLEREISAAYFQNDVFSYTFNEELANNYDMEVKSGEEKESLINSIARSIKINSSDVNNHFRISNSDFNIIYDDFNVGLDNQSLASLPEDSQGHKIVQEKGRYYVQIMVPFKMNEDLYYIENFRDITGVFESRDNQYTLYSLIVFIMILGSAIGTLIISWVLTKPIKKLSQATQAIADGNFKERISTKSYKEVEELSKNFNIMVSELENMVASLKESNVRQEAFIGSFAHEIKTPLTSMIGYADMLRSKKLSEEDILLSANFIFEEGKRVEAISMKLLELIVLKKQDFHMMTVSMESFFQDVHGAMTLIFEKENIAFSMSVQDARLQIEPDLLKTVCINLLDNARKAVSDTEGEVSLLGEAHQDGYIIKICDNGRGMDEAELERITDAFYMIDKSRANIHEGVGLGLSICAEVIKIHDASMTFESKLEQGTCVIIKLKDGGGR